VIPSESEEPADTDRDGDDAERILQVLFDDVAGLTRAPDHLEHLPESCVQQGAELLGDTVIDGFPRRVGEMMDAAKTAIALWHEAQRRRNERVFRDDGADPATREV
ncbi:hypothetical protein E4U40_000135, partial [Claviceps sp. LM458 group G5]